jgi:hypothetical protein
MPDQTAEEIVEQAIQQAKNAIHFDMGKNIQSTFQKEYDDLLWSSIMAEGIVGGGLGGAVALNSAGTTLDEPITLENIQRACESIRAGVREPRYFVGMDYAPGTEIEAMQIMNVGDYKPHARVERYDIFESDGSYGGITRGDSIQSISYPPSSYYRQREGMVEWPAMPAIQREVLQWQYGYNMLVDNFLNAQLGVMGMARETPEERRVWEVKREVATKRAESLLFTILKPEQVRQYSDHGYFETEVNDKLYRITKGHSGNVKLIRNGKIVESYCAHPSNAYGTPEQDTMLAQLLMLKTDEAKFLKTANRTVLLAA